LGKAYLFAEIPVKAGVIGPLFLPSFFHAAFTVIAPSLPTALRSFYLVGPLGWEYLPASCVRILMSFLHSVLVSCQRHGTSFFLFLLPHDLLTAKRCALFLLTPCGMGFIASFCSFLFVLLFTSNDVTPFLSPFIEAPSLLPAAA